MNDLARWIRETRGTTTQEDFARMLGVPVRTLQSWEAGQPPRHPDMVRAAITFVRDIHPEGES